MKAKRHCDKFELRRFVKDGTAPHLYRAPFFHGDGTPAVPVTITWNKRAILSKLADGIEAEAAKLQS